MVLSRFSDAQKEILADFSVDARNKDLSIDEIGEVLVAPQT